ncbi:hypothetical protein OUZ56_004252 [Daphnia magna]|uniref:Uncharacterized protein n=1 Tax=Daphnia magna TaxID=35525 RepID=A0ABQ9YPE5_9CRUS|nr:hypothetical protein OUZ56_004252 [Daphnia magna]
MFHDLIENGRKMLHNFLFDICGLQGVFTLKKREQQCINCIRRMVGPALLQGDDSSEVQDIHIENGFLRKDESEQVVTSFQKLWLILRFDFLRCFHQRAWTLSLCRTVNPEEKRRIISDTFVEVADGMANDLNLTWDNLLLEQAVILPKHLCSLECLSGEWYGNSKHHTGSSYIKETMNASKTTRCLRLGTITPIENEWTQVKSLEETFIESPCNLLLSFESNSTLMQLIYI